MLWIMVKNPAKVQKNIELRNSSYSCFLVLPIAFFKNFFQNLPFSLHAYTILPFSPDGYRVSCSFKPTRSLHDAYISLHDFEALQRADENQLAHLQVFCFLQAKKFSREFCSIQVK